MKSAVVVFPGINRERDMARTLKLISGAAAGDGLARETRNFPPAPIWSSSPAASPMAIICAAVPSRRAAPS